MAAVSETQAPGAIVCSSGLNAMQVPVLCSSIVTDLQLTPVAGSQSQEQVPPADRAWPRSSTSVGYSIVQSGAAVPPVRSCRTTGPLQPAGGAVTHWWVARSQQAPQYI